MADGAGFGCIAPQVRELHIDFLLEEEFSAGPQFLVRFMIAAGRPADSLQIESVDRSVADAFGEADLVVIYRDAMGKRIAILIEDKLRAAFQPDQPERYRQRGLAGLGRDWDGFWTCLVAPKSYICRGHAFDAAVTLESVIEMFGKVDTARGAFKQRVFTEAIRKCGAKGVQVVDVVMTNFRKQHYVWFQEFFRDELARQEIHIRLPGPTYKGDTWFEVRIKLLSRGSYITHKSTMGAVDLSFPDMPVARLEALSPLFEQGMTPVQTNKSASVRVEVEKILNFENFTKEQPRVLDAGNAIKRLLAFFVRERPRFEAILCPELAAPK